MGGVRVLVTGAAGFLGRHLGRCLVEAGYDVASCVRRAEDAAAAPGDRRYAVELPHASLAEIVAHERPEWLLHCAGAARVDQSLLHPETDFQANVAVTEHVLATLAARSPRTRFLFLSSGAVYGEPAELPITERTPPRPISPYGRHKLACEALAREHHRRTGAAVAILRVFSAYGVGLKRQVLWDICRKAAESPLVTLDGTGAERRDFIHVADVARIVLRIVERDAPECETLNVASGTSASIAEVASLLLQNLGTGRRVVFSGQSRPGFPRHWEVNVAPLAKLGLGDFMPLPRGLAEYAAWAAKELGGADARRAVAAAG